MPAVTYAQAVKLVVDKDGVIGLFGRGLSTRIVTNGVQGMVITSPHLIGSDQSGWSGD